MAAKDNPSQQILLFDLKWDLFITYMTDVFQNRLIHDNLDNLDNLVCDIDVTLACDGASIKVHKMILVAMSGYFQKLLLANPCKHPIVILPGVTKFADLKLIINYMYTGEVVHISYEQLSSFLKLAEKLEIKGFIDEEMDANDVCKYLAALRESVH